LGWRILKITADTNVLIRAIGYRFSAAGISEAIRILANTPNVAADRLAIQAGLVFLDAGGGLPAA
jgi:hypothetical protein